MIFTGVTSNFGCRRHRSRRHNLVCTKQDDILCSEWQSHDLRAVFTQQQIAVCTVKLTRQSIWSVSSLIRSSAETKRKPVENGVHRRTCNLSWETRLLDAVGLKILLSLNQFFTFSGMMLKIREGLVTAFWAFASIILSAQSKSYLCSALTFASSVHPERCQVLLLLALQKMALPGMALLGMAALPGMELHGKEEVPPEMERRQACLFPLFVFHMTICRVCYHWSKQKLCYVVFCIFRPCSTILSPDHLRANPVSFCSFVLLWFSCHKHDMHFIDCLRHHVRASFQLVSNRLPTERLFPRGDCMSLRGENVSQFETDPRPPVTGYGRSLNCIWMIFDLWNFNMWINYG